VDDMAKDLYNFEAKSYVLDKIAEHYVSTGLYEVEVIYFNKSPEEKRTYRGKAVNVSKWVRGELLGRFDICNYEYICDTEKERRDAKYWFFVMSCIGTGTGDEVVPERMMQNGHGNLVDRKGLNTFEELIAECNDFFEKLGEDKCIETLHVSVEHPVSNKVEFRNKIINAFKQSGVSDIEILQVTFFDSSKTKEGERPYKCVYDANKTHAEALSSNNGVISKADTFEKGKICEAIVTLSYTVYKRQYFENIESNLLNNGIGLQGYIKTTPSNDKYEVLKLWHIASLRNDNLLAGKGLGYE